MLRQILGQKYLEMTRLLSKQRPTQKEKQYLQKENDLELGRYEVRETGLVPTMSF